MASIRYCDWYIIRMSTVLILDETTCFVASHLDPNGHHWSSNFTANRQRICSHFYLTVIVHCFQRNLIYQNMTANLNTFREVTILHVGVVSAVHLWCRYSCTWCKHMNIICLFELPTARFPLLCHTTFGDYSFIICYFELKLTYVSSLIMQSETNFQMDPKKCNIFPLNHCKNRSLLITSWRCKKRANFTMGANG